MQLTLGPVLYYWPKAKLEAFYAAVAKAPVDRVYLGEAVCSKRHEYRQADWLDTTDMLADAGKEVVLSAQALMDSESDLKALRKIAANGRFLVEANDMGAVQVLGGERPFVAGPHLNIYNAPTLALISGLGAVRWVPPMEMSRGSLAAILVDKPAGMSTEVFALGRIPLAFSARCFTARHYNLGKDDCRFCCIDHPDGLELATQEAEPFLVLNGIQTQSYRVLNLISELPDMLGLGVEAVRLSPQAENMDDVIAAFRSALTGETHSSVGTAFDTLLPAAACNGYWHGRPGQEFVSGPLVGAAA